VTSIAYLGPRGTFAEAALHEMAVSADAELVACATVSAALDAARRAEVTYALVPIENSVEGSVTSTLDELATGEPLVIVDEQAIPVRFALMARPGTALSDVRRIATHPHASAQCRGWIGATLPGAVVIPAGSTAGAAAALVEEPPAYEAAIAPRLAAEVYALEVLADDIGDNDEASTRFVLVSLPGALPARTGADKTTLTLFMREDHPGALLEILTEFAVRGVNLTRIESRPTRKALGDYYFSVDCEGHIDDARVGEALAGLHRICAHVRFLGSYPRHDGRAPLLRPGVTDADFAAADSWLTSVRHRP
jgi:prephenate dehydratase